MALHDSLRELVAARGAAVVDDATELRGALDDFLGEDEATTGELNLLVDAVRLGALDRLLTMLRNGATPSAAVAEAGAALARDRGSDDSRRASWAVAALGFALGRLDAGVVERTLPTAGPATPPPPPPPPVPASDPWPEPRPEPDAGTVGSAEAVPTALERQQSVSAPHPPPQPSTRRRKRRSPVLLAVSFAVVLGLVGGTGLALWLERDTGSEARDPEDPTTSKETEKPAAETIDESSILITYLDGKTGHHVYEVDTAEGGAEPLTTGNQDHLPSISPDRTMVTFQEGDADFPRTLMRLDVGAPAAVPVFKPDQVCAHTLRPGWSPDGQRIALVCTGDDDESDGLYLANPLTGAEFPLVTDQPLLNGSPTWVDENTVVYTEDDATGQPSKLWSLDIDLGSNIADGAPRQLTLQGEPEVRLSHPDWSEEAGKLLFIVHRQEGQFGELWVADADLANPTRIGEGYAHPVWSPRGDAIAFSMQDESGTEILATAPYVEGELLDPVPVEGVPPGEVGIPVWGSR